MAIDEKKFRVLKRQAEEARTASDRAAGQLEATMKRLEEEFGCKTVKAAERKVEELAAEAALVEEAYNEAVEAFEEEWNDLKGEEA